MAPALPAAAAAAAHPSSRPLHSIPRFSPHLDKCTTAAGCMHGTRIADLTSSFTTAKRMLTIANQYVFCRHYRDIPGRDSLCAIARHRGRAAGGEAHWEWPWMAGMVKVTSSSDSVAPSIANRPWRARLTRPRSTPAPPPPAWLLPEDSAAQRIHCKDKLSIAECGGANR